MRNLTAVAIALVFALAGCAAPDEFLLASPDAATADAPSTDRADASTDAGADAADSADVAAASSDVTDASDANGDVADVSTPETDADVTVVDAADASADVFADDGNNADAAQDAPATDAQADVATGDAVSGDGGHDAGADTADVLGDVATDAADAREASVDEVCAAATTIAACTAIRFPDGVHGCGWCVASDRMYDRCAYGERLTPRGASCAEGWVW